jgi:DNA helicase HerA-like ATPase
VQEVPVENNPGLEYIVIGRVLAIPQLPAKLAKNDLFRHLLIAGSTGSGKSHTASKISERVAREFKIPVIVFDWHGEYADLLREYIEVNPHSSPIPIFTDDPDDLILVSSIMELTPSQEYLLDKILRRVDFTKTKSIESLLDYIESYPEESNWMRETKLALHRKLSSLARENYHSLFEIRGRIEFKQGVLEAGKPVVLNLAEINDPNIRRLYASFYLKRLVDFTVNQGRRLLVVLEEAVNYISRSQPVKPICETLREFRKFGVGLVIISQSLTQLVEDASVNTNTKVIHSVKSKQDLEVVEKTLYLDQELLETLPYIEPGEAVYSTPSLKKPVLVKIE